MFRQKWPWLALLLCMSLSIAQFASAKSVTVKVLTQFNDAESTKFNEIVSKFEKVNPGIKIEVERNNDDSGSYYTKLVSTIIGGSAPDIARVEPPKAAQYIAAGYCANLTPYFPKSFASQFFPGTLEPVMKNKKLYGIPQDVSTLLLFYRTDMFEEAKIAGPPKTWDELVSDCKKLTRDTNNDGQNDVYGIGLFGGWGSFEFYPWFWQAGGEMFKEKNGKLIPAFNSKEGINALQFWTDLIYKYKVMPEGAATYTEDDVKGGFVAKNIAMFTSGPWTISSLKANTAINGKWATAPLPKGKKDASVLGGMHLVIMQQSKQKAAAAKFLAFFMRDDVQTDWAKSLNVLPVKKSCYKDPYFAKDPLVIACMDQLKVAKSRPTIPEAGEIDDLFGKAIQAALSKVKTPEAALNEAATAAAKILEKH